MNERVRHRLQIQALEIEELLGQHGVRAEVQGGQSTPHCDRFVATGFDPIDTRTWELLQVALQDSLDSPSTTLELKGAHLQISVSRRECLNLLDLLDRKIQPPPGVATLGWTTDDRPLLLNFADAVMSHVLITGAKGAGKTAALRTCALSLAMVSRQSHVQLLAIDPRCGRPESGAAPGLASLHYLPHALTQVVTNLEDIADVLASLAEEMAYRRLHAIHQPRIVVFVDNLDAVLEDGGAPVRDPLRSLLTGGASSGIHFVMAARPPESGHVDAVNELLKLETVLRIAGRVPTSLESEVATSVSQAGAQNLDGRGDFLIVQDDVAIRFQAAFVDSYDLHWCLETLQRQRPPTLLAHSTPARPPSPVKAHDEHYVHTFTFDGSQISVGVEENEEAKRG